MTQEPPQNPEAPRPPETPSSAWAPRPQQPSTPQETTPPSPPESTSSEPASEAPRVWAPPTLSGTTIGPASAAPPDAATADNAPPPAATTDSGVATAPPSPAPPVTERRRGVPAWLLVIAAIVPAVIVGAAVFFLVGGEEEDDPSSAAGIVDGFMRLGQPNQSSIKSYAGELPPEFSPEFPIYGNAEIVVSITTATEQGTGYLIVMSTPDSTDNVFEFYSNALDQVPWQVEGSRSSEMSTFLRFMRPDNIDVSGGLSLLRSELGEETLIYLSYGDTSQAVLPGGPAEPFTAGASRSLPVGFPEDVPIYQGAEESIIYDTYFERGQGGQAFIVTFLTRDSQDDVIEYYRSEFEGRGWVVSDAGVSSTSFALAIEFDNGPAQTISGSITADSFEDDPAYTQVDVLVTTSNN